MIVEYRHPEVVWDWARPKLIPHCVCKKFNQKGQSSSSSRRWEVPFMRIKFCDPVKNKLEYSSRRVALPYGWMELFYYWKEEEWRGWLDQGVQGHEGSRTGQTRGSQGDEFYVLEIVSPCPFGIARWMPFRSRTVYFAGIITRFKCYMGIPLSFITKGGTGTLFLKSRGTLGIVYWWDTPKYNCVSYLDLLWKRHERERGARGILVVKGSSHVNINTLNSMRS